MWIESGIKIKYTNKQARIYQNIIRTLQKEKKREKKIETGLGDD